MSIELRGISKSYENRIVFYNLNLEIREGRITCIMGPSGSGKTTMLNILMGLVKAEEGEVRGVAGKKLAAVFQEDRLCEELDALRNVLLVCPKKVGPGEVRRHFEEVGLTEYENKEAGQLSGGMKRRVAIVRALLAESDIVIMDEPFKGLDEDLKKRVMEYVRRHAEGKTVIMVTHDKEEALEFSAEILSL